MENTMRYQTAIFVLLLLTGFQSCSVRASDPEPPITNFKECVAAGNPVARSYPPQCRTKDGKVFVDTSKKIEKKKYCTDQCGNGTCEEMVCMAVGCPCAETAETCPEDCAVKKKAVEEPVE